MNPIEAYLAELKSYFSESNMAIYHELEEDLLEEFNQSVAEGKSEEEAVSKLSKPIDIASDFFADRRFETAQSATRDVVPEEEVEDVFRKVQRKRVGRLVHKSFLILKKIAIIILILLGAFFMSYIGLELYFEQNLAHIPTILLLIVIGLLVNLLPKSIAIKPKKRLFLTGIISLLSLGLLIEGELSDQLFYQGVPHYQEITAEGHNNLSFSLDSDAIIEITTSEVGAKEPFRLLLRGNFKKQDIKAISKNDKKKNIKMRVDKKNLFNLFTRTKESEIIILIPKGMVFDKFELNLLQGDLRLLHMGAKELNLNLVEGDIFSKNIDVSEGIIHSQNGDIVIEDSELSGQLTNIDGKTILTHLKGELAIDGTHGHTIIKGQESTEGNVRTIDGKITIQNSAFKTLSAFSESGQIVVARTSGVLTVESLRGKIVSEANSGEMLTKNGSGITVVVDTKGIPSHVVSQSGFIKWIHDVKNPVNFNVSSKTGEVRNEIEPTEEEKEADVSIQSNSGDIRVLKKVD